MRELRILIHGQAAEGDLAWFVARSLCALGHRAATFDVTRHDAKVPRALRSRYRVPGLQQLAVEFANRRFLTRVRRERPDVLLVIKGTYLLPCTIRAARDACGCVVNLFPDGVTELHKTGILESLGEYNRVFTKESYLVGRLRAAGFGNISYLPQCCDPTIHHPVALSAEERARYDADVSLVGSAYPHRVAILSRLPLAAFRLRLWGNGWQYAPAGLAEAYCGGEAVGAAQACVFNASRINLNTAHLQDVCGVNKRTFEITGCGGFQLAPEQPDLPQFFIPGQEIVTYSDASDLAVKILYYLARPDERAAIAAAGRERAHREHTYSQRITQMLSELNLF